MGSHQIQVTVPERTIRLQDGQEKSPSMTNTEYVRLYNVCRLLMK